MKWCLIRSYLFIKSTRLVPRNIPLMVVEIKYNSWEVLRLISNEGFGGIDPVDPFLFHFYTTYYNASVHTDVCLHMLGSYLDACNFIFKQNRMQ